MLARGRSTGSLDSMSEDGFGSCSELRRAVVAPREPVMTPLRLTLAPFEVSGFGFDRRSGWAGAVGAVVPVGQSWRPPSLPGSAFPKKVFGGALQLRWESSNLRWSGRARVFV